MEQPGRGSPPDSKREEQSRMVEQLLRRLRQTDPDLARPARPRLGRVNSGSQPAVAGPVVGPASRPARPWMAWLWALLGLGLGAGLTQWPYPTACGLPLFGYLAAVGVLLATGVVAAVSSWRYRRSVAHVLALVVLLGGLVLAAGVVLPRVGYAREAAAWWCGS